MKYLRILIGCSAIMNIILCASALYLRNMACSLIHDYVISLQALVGKTIHDDTLRGIETMTDGLAELILIILFWLVR